MSLDAKPITLTVEELRHCLEDMDPSARVCLLVGDHAYIVSSATSDESENWLIVEAGVEIPFREDDDG